jgi:hypothetical protein
VGEFLAEQVVEQQPVEKDHPKRFPEEGQQRTPLSHGFSVVVHIALPDGHAGIGNDSRLRYDLWSDLHDAADALPLRHGRIGAPRAGHHHPAFLVGVIGLVLLVFEGSQRISAPLVPAP